jgi:hypothetical protein
MKNLSALLILMFLASSGTAFGDDLFATDDALSITVEGPFKKIRRDRDKSKSYPAVVIQDGTRFDVSLSVRGNTRLKSEVCINPPLWVDFEPKQTAGTLFDHQKHTKLVVQCKLSAVHQDYLRGEFLTYKLYNLLTPESFNVRWVDVEYKDAKKSIEKAAFFIERKSRLSKRNGLKKVDLESAAYADLNAKSAAIGNLFQYVISNVDYSFTTGVEGSCCHNAKLFQGESDKFVPVPYDFDNSGLINPRYAIPNEMLGQKRVTKRLYRGHCKVNPALPAARQLLLSRKHQMLDLIKRDSVLRDKTKKKMGKFLSESFEHLEDENLFEKNIRSACFG